MTTLGTRGSQMAKNGFWVPILYINHYLGVRQDVEHGNVLAST